MSDDMNLAPEVKNAIAVLMAYESASEGRRVSADEALTWLMAMALDMLSDDEDSPKHADVLEARANMLRKLEDFPARENGMINYLTCEELPIVALRHEPAPEIR